MARRSSLIAQARGFLPFLSVRFWGYVARRFYQDRCLRSAGVLAYTTLLAVVPLATVVFGLIAAFPVFQGMRSTIEDFVFTHFIPATGEVVREYLQQFTSQARQLTVPGAIMLFATSLITLAAIDQALNRIWQSEGLRRGLSGFLTYWAILTLGPLLIAASIGLSSYLFSLPLLSGAQLTLGKAGLLNVAPFVLAAVAITLLYLIVPNQTVRTRSAIAGGVLGALFFEIAKRGFALYIENFPTYEVIYGAFSAVPLFLIWIYIVWALLLLGAEITYALDHFEREQAIASAPDQRLYLAVKVLQHLFRASRRGAELGLEDLEEAEPRFTRQAIAGVLVDLEQIAHVARTEHDTWVVKRDLHRTSVADLFKDMTPAWPPVSPEDVAHDAVDGRLEALVADADRGVDEAMSLSLAELFAEAPSTRPDQAAPERREGGSEPASTHDHGPGTRDAQAGPL